MAVVPGQSLSNSDNVDPEGATRAWAERWLSAERLAPYLSTCSGDVVRALDLYEWNASLAQTLMRDISYFEVALRNAYDRVMRESWGGDWLIDDDSPARMPLVRRSKRGELDANHTNRRIIDAAVAGLPRGFTHGSLVASLTLGFWVHLTDRSREAAIWRTCLYRTWPKGIKRASLQHSLNGILRVRNHAAHAERLFDPVRAELSPLAVGSDVVRLLRGLCPEAAERLYGDGSVNPVELFCEEHPAPADVRL